MPTVSLSSASNLPSVFSAIICSMIACTETFGAGSAMRSLSVKSRIDLMFGLRVLRKAGWRFIAIMPRTSMLPRVLSHSVRKLGRPIPTMSTLPDSSASVIAVGVPMPE